MQVKVPLGLEEEVREGMGRVKSWVDDMVESCWVCRELTTDTRSLQEAQHSTHRINE